MTIKTKLADLWRKLTGKPPIQPRDGGPGEPPINKPK